MICWLMVCWLLCVLMFSVELCWKIFDWWCFVVVFVDFGFVFCLWVDCFGGMFDGVLDLFMLVQLLWLCYVCVVMCDGLCELLIVCDEVGVVCVCLYLLFDIDYLVWDVLVVVVCDVFVVLGVLFGCVDWVCWFCFVIQWFGLCELLCVCMFGMVSVLSWCIVQQLVQVEGVCLGG